VREAAEKTQSEMAADVPSKAKLAEGWKWKSWSHFGGHGPGEVALEVFHI